jgi:hypothetical protein
MSKGDKKKKDRAAVWSLYDDNLEGVEWSPSWKATSGSAIQDFAHIFYKSKVHYQYSQQPYTPIQFL